MEIAFSTRYLRLILASEGNLDYKSYLKLGLRCPRKNCQARVFFVGKGKDHQRKLSSGEKVRVKASKAHFSCFNIDECAGDCLRGEMSRRERDRLIAQSRGQRRKKIWSHFLKLFEMSVFDGEFLYKEDVVLFQNSELFRRHFPSFKETYRSQLDYWINMGIEYLEDKIINNFPEFKKELEEEKRKKEIDFASVVWLTEVEYIPHKKHVIEALRFIAQPRQEGLLSWVAAISMFRLFYVGGDITNQWDANFWSQKIISCIVSQFFLIPWAENWQKLDLP